MNTEINEDFKTNKNYNRIYGGVALPGKQPGFAVVVGMGQGDPFKKHDIYILDEFESMDTRELIRQCGVLDFKYHSKMWFGDGLNSAADRFVQEMNHERQAKNKNPELLMPVFSITPTPILEMKQPYTYILPELKSLLCEGREKLFLGQSKIVGYMTSVEPQSLPEIDFGEFPAIEALGFVVIEMRQWSRPSVTSTRKEDDASCAYNVLGL